jgi:hypothetical protein
MGPDSMQAFANQNRISGYGLVAAVTVNRIQAPKRRSTRIALNARIGLSGEDRLKCAFTMPARASNLNKHGAAIQLNRELSVGSCVVVRNDRGTQASARVVAQVSATAQGVHIYGVEFLEDDDVSDFWGISFP